MLATHVAPQSDVQFDVQAEYTDPATLEARLQILARRMVNAAPRRPDSEQATPTPPSQQNGHEGLGQAGGFIPPGPTLGQSPSTCGPQGFSQSSSAIASQDELLASSSVNQQGSMP